MARFFECGDCRLQLLWTHEQVIGIESRDDEQTYFRIREGGRERGDYANFRKSKWSVDLQDAKKCPLFNTIGYVARRREEGKLVGGEGNREKGSLGRPRRDRRSGREACNGKALG